MNLSAFDYAGYAAAAIGAVFGIVLVWCRLVHYALWARLFAAAMVGITAAAIIAATAVIMENTPKNCLCAHYDPSIFRTGGDHA
ncbi:hypothetical protein D2E71_24780 [Mycobacteroides abscessus]|uniref:hypothetical protein n=1 Tax=Mycobacteroides abscessus TaxID=36809 RepID=UPI000C2639EF|nr:hypothetical protein [Mycobacteroides abscessus]RIS37852.1 hypothetical protein D2E71_24780 [Mycobacteroides abscessus]